ncbi:HD-GYP domain-containing protein [Psychrobacillus antarcticus]|uniref:HD-GYP domain-containing protein n=1 Tax=Psychrobacillus antarcticus TaxID=2879115 RepID=UPI002408786F|nr:HD-GYP domain-containing protein [Psychrobacillus antarcticus]
MENRENYVKNTLGSKVIHDIYSENGVLLVPFETLITQEHVKKLIKHDITLPGFTMESINAKRDVKYLEFKKDIDNAVVRAGSLFDDIRETKRIPLSYLRDDVLPVIHEAVQARQVINLLASIQVKDDYTYRHNIAVGMISNLIGTWMSLEHQDLLQLTTAALLHDVGKMFIPIQILNKPGRLTDEEYAIIKNHTLLGYEIMKKTIGINHRQALVALQHHERMNGSGYPFGLTKDKIDLFSRIVSVADIFHAMTSKRVYSNPLPFNEVLVQMEKDVFGELDPAITRLFIEKLMNSLIGHSVMLTDGSEGTILMVQSHNPTRPLIKVNNKFVDLSKDQSIHIKNINFPDAIAE